MSTAATEAATGGVVRIDGAAPLAETGSSVSRAGDVNGDGRPDLIIGAWTADNNGRDASGSAYVVFGGPSLTDLDLANLGNRGFRIDGAAAFDNAGAAVAAAGDVNGDGRADLLVGAGRADSNGRLDSGSVYVVFGKADNTSVDLANLGTGGFRIDAAAAGDHLGYEVDGAGDVNGDGLRDLIVVAWGADNNGRKDSGSAYVVFGMSSPTSVDLANLGSRGFRIDGAAAEDDLNSVAGIGDLNGDGRDDVAVGTWAADNNGRKDSGSAYVVFGKTDTDRIDLAALGPHGFRIDGAIARENVGTPVAAAGDYNGDGRPDLVVGAPGSDPGSAYVVFGKTDTATIDLASPGPAAIRVEGAADGDEAGSAVAGAGDFNGDGRSDLVLGATGRDNPLHDSAIAYVVFGRSGISPIDLGSIGTGGFRMNGTAVDPFGGDVAPAGDVNGDGRADVLVASPLEDNNGRPSSGSVYVVFGRTGTAPIELVPGAAAKLSSSPMFAGSARGLLPTASEAEYAFRFGVKRDRQPRGAPRSGFANGWRASYRDEGAVPATATVDVRVYRRPPDALAAYRNACARCTSNFDWTGFKETRSSRKESGVQLRCYERFERRGTLLIDVSACEPGADATFKGSAFDVGYEIAQVVKKASPRKP